MDLADLIDRNAAFAPDKPAIRFGGATLTYAAFAERIAQAARALKSQLGIGRGDRVAILSLNHPDYLVLLYACARLGAMLVPLNWRLAVPEQVFILSDASVKALVVEKGFEAVIAPLNAALPDVRVIGLDFAPSFDDLLGVRQRRRPQSACRSLGAAADRLHLRHHRAAEGRGAAPGGAGLERRDEPAHARHDGARIMSSPCCRCSMSAD